MLFMGTDNSNDLASIKVVDLKSSESGLRVRRAQGEFLQGKAKRGGGVREASEGEKDGSENSSPASTGENLAERDGERK